MLGPGGGCDVRLRPLVPDADPLVLVWLSARRESSEIAVVTDSPTTDAPFLRDLRSFLRFSFVVHAAFFVLRFTYMWLDDVVRFEPGTFWPRCIEEGTGSLGSFLLSGAVYVAWKRAPLVAPFIWRRAPGYVLLGVAISAANTTFMWGARSLLFPLAGLGAYDYGRMPLRYAMELPGALIGFATMLAIIALATEVHGRQQRAVRESALERALATAQLQAVRTQLQPHFLFNALNTIAARVHDDPAQADTLISQLAELLRASLQAHHATQVPLREELELLEAYVQLMRARFGERLTVTVNTAPGVHNVPVPPLLLQPLVENAIRHGGLEQAGQVRIVVTIARLITGAAEQIAMTVADNGPGMPAGRDPLRSGTGLSSSVERLSLLYGSAASLHAGNAPAGGFHVRVEVPAQSGRAAALVYP